jgi:hypothetical protein
LLGASACAPRTPRAFTEIDCRLLRRPAAAIAAGFTDSLSRFEALEFSVAEELPPQPCITFELDAAILEASGPLRIRVAQSLIDSLLAATVRLALAAEIARLPALFADVQIALQATISAGEVNSIEAGEVIAAGQVGEPIVLNLPGNPVRAQAHQYRGRRAVRVIGSQQDQQEPR